MPKTVQPQDLTLNPFTVFDKRWMLLSAGDFSKGEWNCMTISWGFIGTMWNLPVAQPVVRPQRYTREFMDRFDTFTLCAFPEKFRPALQILGSKSGRDGDKVSEAGLHPTAASKVAAPVFAEADFTIECRKLFRLPMTADSLLGQKPRAMYPAQDYHIMYIGEVLAIGNE